MFDFILGMLILSAIIAVCMVVGDHFHESMWG